jgi:hypothetical protein
MASLPELVGVQAFVLLSTFLIVIFRPEPVAAGRLMVTAPLLASQAMYPSADATEYGELPAVTEATVL